MRVTELFSYPIKGCYRNEHDDARVQPWGLTGDRRFMVIDAEGRMLTQREEPAMVRVKPRYDGDKLVLSAAGQTDLIVAPAPGPLVDTFVHVTPIRAGLVGPVADAWLSEVLERRVRLVYLDDPRRRPIGRDASRPDDRVSFADAYPILLVSTASLAALNGWLAEESDEPGPLPVTRFRPNVVIGGAAAWAEDGFAGRVLRIGEVEFRGAVSVGRCVVTTTDQDTGRRGHEPLRTLARHRNIDRKLRFGMYMIPDSEGVIRLGDEVWVCG